MVPRGSCLQATLVCNCNSFSGNNCKDGSQVYSLCLIMVKAQELTAIPVTLGCSWVKCDTFFKVWQRYHRFRDDIQPRCSR